MTRLRSEFLFSLTAGVAPPQNVGPSPAGYRRIIPIPGGSFEGPKLRGSVLAGGGDWMLVRSDGVAQVDARITLQTDDGDVIFMRYSGFAHGPKEVMDRLGRGEGVDPTAYYLRVTPLFETASPKYAWLNRIIAVGTGQRLPQGVTYDIYEIL
jgi:hypothetical protein